MGVSRRLRLAALAVLGLLAPLPLFMAASVLLPGVQQLVYGALYLPLGAVDATKAAYVLGSLFGVALALVVVAGVAYYFEEWWGVAASLLGSLPALILIAFLTLFGLGWGWGYVVTAEEVGSTVDEPVLDVYPDALNEMLIDCQETGERTECHMELRGMEDDSGDHITDWLHRRGVTCPFPGSGADGGSAYVIHNTSVYQVSCSPHGD